MSDVDKMYQAPDKLGEIQQPSDSGSGVSPNARLSIGQAAPWLKFMGIMGFIGCGLLAVSAVGVMFAIGVAGGRLGEYSGIAAGTMILLGVVYLGLAVLYFFPALFTLRMGAGGSAFSSQGQSSGLDDLTLNLRKWAKFNGILIIVGLSVGALALIGWVAYFITNIASKGL
jgi:hypothetical protein